MRWKSGKQIGIYSVLVFVAIALCVMISSLFVQQKLREQELAEKKRLEYRNLSDSLANASDYLTAEVRYFAVTGDLEHLYNYWMEIHETQRRNKAIEQFEDGKLPQKELELLESAKKYSDLLVETEARSMKLKLMSMGKKKEDYIGTKYYKYVQEIFLYQLLEEQEDLSQERMGQIAMELLYDSYYEDMKEKILSPITEFQSIVNERLDNAVEEKSNQTHFATSVQIFSSIATIISIMILVKILDLFFKELASRKEAEEKMRQARNEAELANEAKSVFLAQITHELRTPLNAVNGYTYLLEQTSMSENQIRYVNNIRHSSAGLLELINQILDFTKIDSGKLEFERAPFKIQDLVEEICQIFLLRVEEKGLELHWEVEENIPILMGDSLRLRQVLMNLIGNAIKFTEVGSVDVRVRMESQNESTCVLYFEVQDTGIGIEHGMKEKIFEPFAQADASVSRKYGGTGLGIPISSQIIALAGNGQHRLHLNSMPGKGSKFFFRVDFEITDDEVEQEESEIIVWDGTGRKVLIVDDNRINLSIQKELLRLCHLFVYTASSGKEALWILENCRDIDLIFMDIRMPEMDGYETVKELRKIDGYKEIPVIALTADATSDVVSKCIDATMIDCILKPIEQRKLYDMVGKYLNLKVQLQIKLKDGIGDSLDMKDGNVIFFDEEKCLKKLSNNKGLLYQMVGTFLEFHGEDGVRLKQLIEENRISEAEELLHLLKGVAGNLCCNYLIGETGNVRTALKNGLLETEKAMGQFLGIWNKTLRELQICHQKYKKLLKIDLSENKPGQIVTLEKEQLDLMIELCEARDTEAVTLIENNALNLSTIMDKDNYLNLKKSSLRYDFVTMANCLGKLKREMT